LIKFAALVKKFLEFCHDHITGTIAPKDLEYATDMEMKIDHFRKTLRKDSVHRMQDQDSVKVEMICISILGEMEKIGNHCLNIIQTLSRKHHA